MSPTGHSLKLKPGDNVRLEEKHLSERDNPREVFEVVGGPAHGKEGDFVVKGKLTGREKVFRSTVGAFKEKVED